MAALPESLRAAGLDGAVGQALAYPAAVGPAGPVRHRPRHSHLVLVLPEDIAVAPESAAQALVEGVLLARYRYPVLTAEADGRPALESVRLLAPAGVLEAVERGAERGRVPARTQAVSRDLANCPPSMMTAALGPGAPVHLH